MLSRSDRAGDHPGQPHSCRSVTPLAPLAQAAALLWDAEEVRDLAAIAQPPPVPLTAIVSRDDGIIDWRASVPAPSEMVEVVEVSGPHMAICSNPEVQRIVADRLARTPK